MKIFKKCSPPTRKNLGYAHVVLYAVKGYDELLKLAVGGNTSAVDVTQMEITGKMFATMDPQALGPLANMGDLSQLLQNINLDGTIFSLGKVADHSMPGTLITLFCTYSALLPFSSTLVDANAPLMYLQATSKTIVLPLRDQNFTTREVLNGEGPQVRSLLREKNIFLIYEFSCLFNYQLLYHKIFEMYSR